MRRLISFVTSFVIGLALLINIGCVTVRPNVFDSVIPKWEEPQSEEDWKPKRELGWQPMDQDGNHWDLYVLIGGELQLLATCDFTFMSQQSVEIWKGKYFGMTDSMNYHGPIWHDELENLVGCVDWVKLFYYGDYAI